MSEPDYLRQNGEFATMTPDERWDWRDVTVKEAVAQGSTWVRVSVDDHENTTMMLVEGWKVRPDDEGPTRWQLTEAKP